MSKTVKMKRSNTVADVHLSEVQNYKDAGWVEEGESTDLGDGSEIGDPDGPSELGEGQEESTATDGTGETSEAEETGNETTGDMSEDDERVLQWMRDNEPAKKPTIPEIKEATGIKASGEDLTRLYAMYQGEKDTL